MVRLLAVGRLVTQKRYDRFLSILARVRGQVGRQIEAVIVGSGPLRKQLEEQAARLGLLPGVVEFKGTVADLAPVYQQADILVLTSDWEGTPNVVLEAMASGLPVVATSVGGVCEIVRDGVTGYLVEPGQDSLMVERLVQLACNRQLRMEFGARTREFVEQHCSVRKLPLFLESLYECALS